MTSPWYFSTGAPLSREVHASTVSPGQYTVRKFSNISGQRDGSMQDHAAVRDIDWCQSSLDDVVDGVVSHMTTSGLVTGKAINTRGVCTPQYTCVVHTLWHRGAKRQQYAVSCHRASTFQLTSREWRSRSLIARMRNSNAWLGFVQRWLHLFIFQVSLQMAHIRYFGPCPQWIRYCCNASRLPSYRQFGTVTIHQGWTRDVNSQDRDETLANSRPLRGVVKVISCSRQGWSTIAKDLHFQHDFININQQQNNSSLFK